jgi:predicted NBD/HSP70 family sugar kinase
MTEEQPAAVAPAYGCGALLQILRRERMASRSELAERTGLSRATVVQRLEQLERLGLVADAGRRPSTGGRPAVVFRFAADAGVLLACDIGATHCRLAVTDLARRVLAEVCLDLEVADGPERVFATIRPLLAGMLDRLVRSPRDVMGIGVGLPGPVEYATGRPIDPPIMPGWDGVDVPSYLADFGSLVLVDNDVNVLALGEHGAFFPDCADFLFIKVGTGIGCGAIGGGRLHRGAQGAAGDIGHIAATGSDVLCRCGNRGCLEAVASGGALARDLAAQGMDVRDSRDVVRLVRERDPRAVAAVRTAGRDIGEVLAGAVSFFNPAVLVVGGDVAEAGDELLAGVRETVYQRSLTLATRRLEIVASRLGDAAGVIGAASMASDALFDPVRIDSIVARAGGTQEAVSRALTAPVEMRSMHG